MRRVRAATGTAGALRVRRSILALAVLLLAVVFALTAGFCVGPPSYYTAKYQPVAATDAPARVPAALVPEVQTERHTCGYHAMSSLYRAYGLEPDDMNLRFRLGVDKPAFRLVSDTQGTIHPDMLRVLVQDGFSVRALDVDGPDAAASLREHLANGHHALVLTRASGYHWVAVSESSSGEIEVCDSLHPQTYTRELEQYMRGPIYSVLLIDSRVAAELPGTFEVHAQGIGEMKDAAGR